MSPFQALILGLIQGLTEFLPISSTAHLILVPWLLGWTFDPATAFVFDVLLQLGTLVAVIAYFWRDLLGIAQAVLAGLVARQPFATADARLGWWVVVATIPAGVIGLLFKDYFEALHQQPPVIAGILLGAAVLLFASEALGRRTRTLNDLTWLDAFLIGCAQSLALIPGVSRSASTIAGGLARNLERPAAARFSFIMSIPIMLAAGAAAVKDLLEIPNFTALLPPLSVGFVAAALMGYACIHWLLGYLAKRPLNMFGWYRLVAGALCLVVFFVRGY